MEIKDYIRYKDEGIQKIGRIEKISATLADDVLIIEVDNGDVITSDDVLKSDKKIIREIEVEDYVNGRKIDFISEDGLYSDYNNADYYYFTKEDINSIVTKQQFETMQYVVRRD